jgi:hypothetical protein
LTRTLSWGPFEISPKEIEDTWERLEEHTLEGFYAFYRSPNHNFRALVDGEGAVAVMWSVRTGLIYQADGRVMQSIVKKLMGQIAQVQTSGFSEEDPGIDDVVEDERRTQS